MAEEWGWPIITRVRRLACPAQAYIPRGQPLYPQKTGYGVKSREEYDLNRAIVASPGYTIAKEFYSPRYETFAERNSPTPDLRTTLYWDPDVTTDASGRAVVDFYSADTVGSYTIIIEGVTEDGRPVYSKQSIGR